MAKGDGFGTQLRLRRLAAGLTQDALAARSGVAVRTISDIERGVIHTPWRTTLARLASGLGLDEAEQTTFFAAVPKRRGPSRRAQWLSNALLPQPPAPLVGREAELTQAVALLRRPDVRLLTVRGPVGVGKTRLSLAIAARLRPRFADGVGFIELATLTDPALLPGAIAQALGLLLPASVPPLVALARQLANRQLLLVLDNLEQVDAGPVVAELLAGTHRLKILVTSRRPLRIRGEQEFPLGPLALPDLAHLPPLDRLAQIGAIAFFVQRAQADLPHFRLTTENAATVAEICVRLDGLPLAIELAASRAKIFTPAELLARLLPRHAFLSNGDLDLPARQRSLTAAIAWSHGLLSASAKTLFARLAVFPGGATLAAIEAVCADTEASQNRRLVGPHHLPLRDVWEALRELLDASLLRREDAEDDEVRFSMLETIREYALQQLAASGEEDAVRARQAAWAVTLAEIAEDHLFTDAEESWLRRLERERANLRAALTWAIAAGDETTALRLAGALADFWYLRGHIAEGGEALQRALAIGQTASPARVKALVGACLIAQLRGEANAAVAYGEAGLALARRLEDRAGVAKALTMLGNAVQNAGDYARARLLHEEALAEFLELEEPSWIATELCNLAWCWHGLGDDAAAIACLERLSTTGALAHDSFFAVLASLIRGDVALAAGDLGAAAGHYDEALAGARQRGDRWLAADALIGFAAALGATGQARLAARLLGTAAAIYREIGAPFSPRDRPHYPCWLASIKSQLGEAVFAEAWAEGSELTLERAIGEATRVATMLRSRQPCASAAC